MRTLKKKTSGAIDKLVETPPDHWITAGANDTKFLTAWLIRIRRISSVSFSFSPSFWGNSLVYNLTLIFIRGSEYIWIAVI